MRRLLAIAVVVGVLLAITAPAALAGPPVQWQWDDTYSQTAEEFCGFPVVVHDHGVARVPRYVDQWDLTQVWQGTREYTADGRTATMEWSWVTTSAIESQTSTTMMVLVTTHGTNRIRASNAAVVTSDSGQISYRWSYTMVDGSWVQDLPAAPAFDWHGPHTLDFENNFCDVMGALLSPAT